MDGFVFTMVRPPRTPPPFSRSGSGDSLGQTVTPVTRQANMSAPGLDRLLASPPLLPVSLNVRNSCVRIWLCLDLVDHGAGRSSAEAPLANSTLPEADAYVESNASSQRCLPSKIEANAANDSTNKHLILHFLFKRVWGAGAWLTAIHDSRDPVISSPLFL